MQKRLADHDDGCFLNVMSTFSYPSRTARRGALLTLVAGLVGSVGGLHGSTFAPSQSDVVGVTLQSTNSAVGGYATSSSFTSSGSSTRTVRFNFSGLYLFGGEFIDLSSLAPLSPSSESLQGTLLGVAIDILPGNFTGEPPVILGGDQTYASDLTILVANRSAGNPTIGSGTDIVLQVGGLTDIAPFGVERGSWYPLGGDPGNEASGSYTLNSPGISLPASPSDPAIWLGHGFLSSAYAGTSTSTWGTWTGYVEFTFAGSGGSGVPDASGTALLLAPGTLLLLGLAGRSRRRV
jgi:hypothetical protein